MTETKRFHIGDLLTVSTGKLVSPTRVDGLYSILNWLTGDSLFTHQLPAAGNATKEHLLAQFPWLREITAPEDFSSGAPKVVGVEQGVHAWVAEQAAKYGEYHLVEPAPKSAWGTHDPIADLSAMLRPDQQMIVVEIPAEGENS